MPGLLEESPTSQDDTKQPTSTSTSSSGLGAALPKGVVLDKDGKPCRTCTSSSAWLAMMKSSTKANPPTTITNNTSSSATTQQAQPIHPTSTSTSISTEDPDPTTDCPPDVDSLGRSTWTLLHSLTATYPTSPTPTHQRKTHTFLTLFSQLYPCWVCAEDFQDWMAQPENDVAEALKSQERFGRWMCSAHNAVNVKLGKEEFDCEFWRERWKDGWGDGRCG